ncbi:putative type VI secretion system protein [Escherichia coli]|nr:putative type VI secretion system protein [Escherichia coli]
MSNYALTQTIVTGSDPRALPEFSAIREEINKANHPSQPELNWKLVESLALSIFKANGVDLHTATYYTLARTRNQGLAGFCEGSELLAAMITHEWDKFWPQGGPARTEMLDWFNTRTGNILRQQVSFSENDLPLLYRTERALQLICDKLQQVELKRQPRVENLLYFVQNTRKRFEPQPGNRTDTAAQTTVRTLVYAPESTASTTAEAVPPLPDLPEMRVEVRGVANNADNVRQGSTVKGFVAGAACTAVIAAVLWWWQAYPIQRQLTQVRDTAQGAATAWLASPVLKEYEQYLQQLLDAPPLQPLETGMQMMRTADTLWPESLQQQEASRMWSNTLRNRAQASPQMKGWQQARQNLRDFADLMMKKETEKQGFTLSYIKTVTWQAERLLNQETPLEYLLTQYQETRARKQDTQALEKEINERLDGLLSRWLLLKNTGQDMATDTRTEPVHPDSLRLRRITMANPVYLTLNGELQGLISSGCSSMPSIGNKAQIAHQDQIMVMSLSHGLSRAQNVNHQELTITKPVDKSSPLLGKAISENECLTCDFVFYRTNRFGINEPYYKLKLTNARISNIGLTVPHTINDSPGQPEESVSFTYESINWEHIVAGTSAYSLWSERIF